MKQELKPLLLLLISAAVFPAVFLIVEVLIGRPNPLVLISAAFSIIIAYLVMFSVKTIPFFQKVMVLFSAGLALFIPLILMLALDKSYATPHTGYASIIASALFCIFFFINSLTILIFLKNKLEKITYKDLYTPIIGSSFFVGCWIATLHINQLIGAPILLRKLGLYGYLFLSIPAIILQGFLLGILFKKMNGIEKKNMTLGFTAAALAFAIPAIISFVLITFIFIEGL